MRILGVIYVISIVCFGRDIHYLGIMLQNFPGGMPPDPPIMVLPSVLPLKLICDVTQVTSRDVTKTCRPSEIFCVRHCTAPAESCVASHAKSINHSSLNFMVLSYTTFQP